MIRNEDGPKFDPDDFYPAPKEDFWDVLYEGEDCAKLGETACDEQGDSVECDLCGNQITFFEDKKTWMCSSCLTEISRGQWFDWIGADPPGDKCLKECQENYPMCRITCSFYKVSDDDPLWS